MKKPVLGYCDWCGKALYAGKILFGRGWNIFGSSKYCSEKCRTAHEKSK